VVDLLLGWLQRRLTPPGVRVAAGEASRTSEARS
jgi:hypothetical protein